MSKALSSFFNWDILSSSSFREGRFSLSSVISVVKGDDFTKDFFCVCVDLDKDDQLDVDVFFGIDERFVFVIEGLSSISS